MYRRVPTGARLLPLLCLPLALAATRALAQEPVRPAPAAIAADTLRPVALPPETAAALIDFANAPGTIQLRGPARVPAGSTLAGDVVSLGGPLTIAGRIDGRVVVINGDLALQSGAFVAGGVTVVGGVITGGEGASIGGEVAVYPERLRFRLQQGRLALATPAEPALQLPLGSRWLSRSDFLVSTGNSYNRVEGLPIAFGPVLETASANPLRLRAMGIYRTESGASLDAEELGYDVRAEHFVGGYRRARLGAALYSVIDPIEADHLSNLENGLATFLLHQDYRDHYARRGGAVSAAVEPAGAPLLLRTEMRWERHASRAAGSPWAIFRNAEPWRPQPLVAEGALRSLALQAAYDTRSETVDPAWGWWIRGDMERSLGTSLVRPEAVQVDLEGVAAVLPAERYGDFTAGTLDVRRYNRLSPDSRLNLRLFAAGSLDGGALPPQRQRALGGEGTLPGFALFQTDCGARRHTVYREAPPVRPLSAADGEELPRFFANYGCDAVALLQAEYRGELRLGFLWDGDPWAAGGDRGGWYPGWLAAPEWALFVDAGRGWAYGRGGARVSDGAAVDLGLGLVFSRFGLYAAVPLTGRGGVNFFARLGPRF
jgi:hypothetical protein